MATPQTEDGYTMIANELLEAILRFDFSKRHLKVVLAVIRKTYGYKKKMDDISLSQLSRLTGVKPAHLSVTVRELGQMKVLLIQEGRYAQSIGLNKKYPDWRGLPKQEGGYQNSNRGVTKTVTEGLPKQEPQKKTPKENIKRKAESYDSDFLSFWEFYPRKDDKKKSGVAWRRLTKEKKAQALAHIKTLPYSTTEKRFIPLPTTYINGERWEDQGISSTSERMKGVR